MWWLRCILHCLPTMHWRCNECKCLIAHFRDQIAYRVLPSQRGTVTSSWDRAAKCYATVCSSDTRSDCCLVLRAEFISFLAENISPEQSEIEQKHETQSPSAIIWRRFSLARQHLMFLGSRCSHGARKKKVKLSSHDSQWFLKWMWPIRSTQVATSSVKVPNTAVPQGATWWWLQK